MPAKRFDPRAAVGSGWFRPMEGTVPHGVPTGRVDALFRLPVGEGFPLFQPGRDGRRFLVYEPEGGQLDKPTVVFENRSACLQKSGRPNDSFGLCDPHVTLIEHPVGI